MNPRVELVYDRDCPNVAVARATLLQAFAALGAPPSWTEWDRRAPESPPYVRGYGSPTILVDGEDVASAAPGTGADSCRVYIGGARDLARAPSVAQVRAALQASRTAGSADPKKDVPRSVWRGLLAAAPGIGASLLPVGFCPACWPAYAGSLGSLGVGFLQDAHYRFPLTLALLALALASLGWRARSRRGYRPFQLGLLGAALILAGKFLYGSDPATYLGVAALFSAALWNAWSRRVAAVPACAACAPAGELLNQRAHN